MIKSKHFWIAAMLIAIIPLLGIDIPLHVVDWRKEVREEIIVAVHDSYSLPKDQKAAVLDRIFARNEELILLIGVKIFACIACLVLAIFLFRKYRQYEHPLTIKPLLFTIAVVFAFLSVKIFVINEWNDNDKIKFIALPPDTNSFKKLYAERFKDKVVYVDFWGTTCGPCLEEFRNFTKPLKDHYQQQSDLSYLYISRGNRYIWKKQVGKYDVEGYHVFLDDTEYDNLFREMTKDSAVFMPRYLIIDNKGGIAVQNAPRPSDKDSLYLLLDKYLN